MKKKQKPQQIADKNLATIFKTIQRDIQTIKIDLKMVKVDVGLEKVAMNQSLRSLTRGVEQNQEEIKTLKKELKKMRDDLTADIARLHDRIDDTTQAIRDEATKYHDNLVTKLDFIAGRIKKFDEEHDILTYRQSNHGERIEKLETSIFGKPSE